jgi:hypothetical protein
MAEFQSVKMTRKRDGAERVATTQAEQVAAEFDGFTVSAGSKAAATRRSRKGSAKNTGGASKTAAAGGPVAKTAAPKVASTPAADTAK